jgi:hypothetical protein
MIFDLDRAWFWRTKESSFCGLERQESGVRLVVAEGQAPAVVWEVLVRFDFEVAEVLEVQWTFASSDERRLD